MTNDLVCPSCKRERKKHLSNFIYLIKGPYYKMKFKDIVEDASLVERILNSPPPRYNATYDALQEYCGFFYTLKEVEVEVEA